MEHLITEKLGLGFSRPPFAAIVVKIMLVLFYLLSIF